MWIEIEDIWLMCERVKFHNPAVQRELNSEHLKYYVDKPQFSLVSVGTGLQYLSSTHVIPVNTSCVYVAISFAFQIFGDTSGRRASDITKLTMPKNHKKITFRLDDQPILFSEGLQIRAIQPHACPDTALLYEYLRDEELIDMDFESFSCLPSKMSFNQAFMVDCSKFGLKSPAKLTVELEYESQSLSEAGRMVAVICPVETCIQRTKNGIWSRQD